MSRQQIAAIGSFLLLSGIAGLVLLLISQAGALRIWVSYPLREHAPLWTLVFCAMIGVGLWQAWRATHVHAKWRPTRPGRRFQSVVVYSKHDCPLCDEAVQLLSAYRRWLPPITEVDIASDALLESQFAEEIPIVQIDGKTRFRGHVSEVLLRRLIEGAAAHR